MQICTICGENKPKADYYKNHKRCKVCYLLWCKEKYAQNPDAWRDSRYKNKFGISVEQYDAILEVQDGRCAICRNKPRKQRLAIDHDHKTKKVRGLLCTWCNYKLLGGAREKVENLRRAIAYLEDPPADLVLDIVEQEE